jgi:hypothetical protein
MSRLFTFGCSFTNYRWSTWPTVLLQNLITLKIGGKPEAAIITFLTQ